MKAEDVYNETLAWAKEYDNEFASLIEKHKDLTVSALNIDREIERPRKDIGAYSEVKRLYSYFYNELLNREELLNFDAKFANETIKEFLYALLSVAKPHFPATSLQSSRRRWSSLSPHFSFDF